MKLSLKYCLYFLLPMLCATLTAYVLYKIMPATETPLNYPSVPATPVLSFAPINFSDCQPIPFHLTDGLAIDTEGTVNNTGFQEITTYHAIVNGSSNNDNTNNSGSDEPQGLERNGGLIDSLGNGDTSSTVESHTDDEIAGLSTDQLKSMKESYSDGRNSEERCYNTYARELTKAENIGNQHHIEHYQDEMEYHSNNVAQYETNVAQIDQELARRETANSPDANSTNASSTDAGSTNRNIRSPLDQFEIRVLFTIFIPVLGFIKMSFTNMGLFLTISVYINWVIISMIVIYNKIKASKWYAGLESLYTTIYSIVINQINDKTGQMFYPFMYNLFTYILVNNLIGMIPYCFSSTSHFIAGFLLSFTVVIGCTILGLVLHKTYFWSLLVPSNCPKGLLLLLVLIELISYLARNISLGLRLAANILSGHMLLNILSGFTFDISKANVPTSVIIALFPFAFIAAFTVLEIAICFIQAQVFTVLSSSYVFDGICLH